LRLLLLLLLLLLLGSIVTVVAARIISIIQEVNTKSTQYVIMLFIQNYNVFRQPLRTYSHAPPYQHTSGSSSS